jgi:hypothetical protein
MSHRYVSEDKKSAILKKKMPLTVRRTTRHKMNRHSLFALHAAHSTYDGQHVVR